jgi:hypothetical protein
VQFCKPHWEKLRADVSKYGLDHLIAPDGAAAAAMMARQVEGKAGPLDFDPLMNAHNQLMSMAMSLMGLALMEGNKCPACELHDYNWIEGAAYQSRLYAEKNGLLLEE